MYSFIMIYESINLGILCFIGCCFLMLWFCYLMTSAEVCLICKSFNLAALGKSSSTLDQPIHLFIFMMWYAWNFIPSFNLSFFFSTSYFPASYIISWYIRFISLWIFCLNLLISFDNLDICILHVARNFCSFEWLDIFRPITDDWIIWAELWSWTPFSLTWWLSMKLLASEMLSPIWWSMIGKKLASQGSGIFQFD